MDCLAITNLSLSYSEAVWYSIVMKMGSNSRGYLRLGSIMLWWIYDSPIFFYACALSSCYVPHGLFNVAVGLFSYCWK